jgi:hypothetical protein
VGRALAQVQAPVVQPRISRRRRAQPLGDAVAEHAPDQLGTTGPDLGCALAAPAPVALEELPCLGQQLVGHRHAAVRPAPAQTGIDVPVVLGSATVLSVTRSHMRLARQAEGLRAERAVELHVAAEVHRHAVQVLRSGATAGSAFISARSSANSTSGCSRVVPWRRTPASVIT